MDIREGRARVGALELAYEDWGDPAAPPLLLIMGFGAQLLLWPEGFCAALVRRGLRVIRFDNRDVGQSSRLSWPGGRPPSVWPVLGRGLLGKTSAVPYRLEAMAADVVGLLDHLGLERAHVLGGSMGGMIAQILAADWPQRVARLGILFSSTNQPLLPLPSVRLLGSLLRRPPADLSADQALARQKALLRAIESPRYRQSEADLEHLVQRILARGVDVDGVQRQLFALLGSGDLRPFARRIQAPTLVVHGARDPLLRPACGRAVARAIPGARFELVPEMAHDLPAALWPRLSDTFADFFLAP
ncbi:alpha/beta fold hydrolase [Pseudomonas oryzihabitans]|uniref:alpha/beta fold hydrolase n=1 Tax=Pseudomonas oryzihabitans TaxID=47885 RepID=UPI00119E1F6C|nr:alpha/beta fold hydrolase [Pseudomonas psychrotolerans]